MSADLQAKYNALLRKFIGDSTLVIDGDTENELAKDIAAAMKEKAKRVESLMRLQPGMTGQSAKTCSCDPLEKFRGLSGQVHYPPPQY